MRRHARYPTRPAHRKHPVPVVALGDRATIGQEPALAERAGVSNRIDLEEILLVAAEAHHPRGELHRIGDPRITRLGVDLQELAREIPDRPVGVVGAHDHLHDMPDRTLGQDDNVPRRRGRGNQAQLLNDRPRRACPLRALPVSQEPPRPQPTIDLRPKLRHLTPHARRGQPHMPLDVIVAVGRGGHDLPEHLRRKVAHDLPEIPPLTTASAHHPAILAPRPERRTHAPVVYQFDSRRFLAARRSAGDCSHRGLRPLRMTTMQGTPTTTTPAMSTTSLPSTRNKTATATQITKNGSLNRLFGRSLIDQFYLSAIAWWSRRVSVLHVFVECHPAGVRLLRC